MHKPDKTNWVTATYDEMVQKVDAVLHSAGFTRPPPFPDTPEARPAPAGYVIFSIFETAVDGVREDLRDWIVRHPDFASTFAEGKVQFDLGDDENGQAVLSKGYLNPTWADVLVEAERSCRGRGAPELDHVFLESVEPNGTGADGAAFWELHFGS